VLFVPKLRRGTEAELDVDVEANMGGRRQNEAREGGIQLDGEGALRRRLGLGADKDEDEVVNVDM